MKCMKEIEIDMVLNVPEGVTEDIVWSKFIEFIEANGWKANGMIKELKEEDFTNCV